MMYGIIAVALIFILANLPQYIRKQLTEKIADESSKAKENLQTSQLNFLTKIEWLRFFPLKKILLGVIWLFCLFYAGQSQKFMKNLMNDRFQGSMNDAISFMWY